MLHCPPSTRSCANGVPEKSLVRNTTIHQLNDSLHGSSHLLMCKCPLLPTVCSMLVQSFSEGYTKSKAAIVVCTANRTAVLGLYLIGT